MRALLACVLVPLGASAAPPSVGLDLSGLEASTFEQLDGVAFEKSATVRLVQEGFAVLAPSAAPTVRVRVSVVEAPRTVVLRAEGPKGADQREVPWSNEALGELHLELTQKLVELTRAVAVAPEPAPPVVTARPPPPPERWLSLGLHAGALLRPGGTDPYAVVRFRGGAFVRALVDVSVSGSRGSALSVVELEARAGVGLDFALSDLLDLEVGVLAGALVHTWWLDDPDALAANGTRASPVVVASLAIAYRVSDAWRFEARLTPGYSQAREHLSGSTTLWQRDTFRLETTLGLSASF